MVPMVWRIAGTYYINRKKGIFRSNAALPTAVRSVIRIVLLIKCTELRMKQIDVPEDDVDPTEQEEEEDKAAEKVMLENMSRQELIRRRREMDAKEKDRARRRQDWKDSRQHRLQQGRALNVRDLMLIFCFSFVG